MLPNDHGQRALDALDAALFAEIGARFGVVLVSEYGRLPSASEVRADLMGLARPGPGNLDAAVAAFDRGLGDLIDAHARCRAVVAKRFAQQPAQPEGSNTMKGALKTATAAAAVSFGSVVDWLAGKKTNIAAGVGIAAVIVNHFVHVPGMTNDPANWINDIYTLVLVLTGRAALARIESKVS